MAFSSMEQAETIRGNRKFDVIRQLQSDKTLIKMKVIGKPYEHLTMVTGIRTDKPGPAFLIDYPAGFREAVANDGRCRIYFEFIGSDNIIYHFRTVGSELINNEICIHFPDTIQRLQRRNDFRVVPPLGTRLCLDIKAGRQAFSILNLSRRGALLTLSEAPGKSDDALSLSIGSRLKNIELVFPSTKPAAIVKIREALVKRLGKNPLTRRETGALEFCDIEKGQEKVLTRLLYKFQRALLQRKMTELQ